MKSITLGSLFDGSGGFPLAGTHAGMTPVWAAEIEPYPIAVSSLHFPQMKHLGDVSQIDGETITPVDIITFGSPCQDMSIAGKRKGIKHKDKGDDETTRSGLFYEAIRIIKEMRETTHGKYPKYAVWENVYGAFSSNKGEDFRCVLEEFTRICDEKSSIPRPTDGKWRNAGEIVGDNFSIAWRLFDAQYWGVPQRRKRIYLVANFTGRYAGKILFERESLRGHPAPGRATGQGAGADAPGSTGGSRGIECLNPWDAQTIRQYAIDGVFPALGANSGGGQNRAGVCFAQNQRDELHDLGEKTGALAAEQGMHQQNFIALKCLNPWDCQSKRVYEPDGVYPTLPAMGDGGANNQAVMYTLDSVSSNSMKSSNPHSGFHEETVAKTLQAGGVAPTCNQGGNVIVEPVYALQGNGIDRGQNVVRYDARGNGNGTHCPTLTGDHENCMTDYTAVCCITGDGTAHAEIDMDKSETLRARHPNTIVVNDRSQRKYIIRRLTPLECCRLQGFPDGWGDLPEKENMTDEEFAFWQAVRDTYARINSKATKSYTPSALLKWYNKLHTDSAEYKMWGNGIALPCAKFIMEGIAELCKED